MSDKATLLHEAEATFSALCRSIDGLTDDEMQRVWLGGWGTREVLIHISGWHEAMVPALGHIARGESPYPAGTYDDYDAWNARFVAARVGVKPADVVAELEASHRTFIAAARAVSETHFSPDGAARSIFEGCGPAHYREHTEQIRAQYPPRAA